MTYPRTDEDWERLAECIVTRRPGVSPELVGGFTVDATATIFTWYKGEERRKALDERQYARDRLMELAREAGCLSELGGLPWEKPKEVVEHGSYVIFTNLDTGETKQYYNINPPDSQEVVSAAMFIKPILEERWGKNIKFDIVPAEKLPGGQTQRGMYPREYKGYIIDTGIQMPSYDIYEYNIFETRGQHEQGSPVHTSESEGEAEAWIDRQVSLGG